MPGKYTPLENYLRDLPESQREVTLGFELIERVLNDKLPPSAYQYQAWWANEKNPHQPEKRAIMNAGWKVGAALTESKIITNGRFQCPKSNTKSSRP